MILPIVFILIFNLLCFFFVFIGILVKKKKKSWERLHQGHQARLRFQLELL